MDIRVRSLRKSADMANSEDNTAFETVNLREFELNQVESNGQELNHGKKRLSLDEHTSTTFNMDQTMQEKGPMPEELVNIYIDTGNYKDRDSDDTEDCENQGKDRALKIAKQKSRFEWAFSAHNLLMITFASNFILLVVKAVIFFTTSSLVVFASMVDSLLDVMSSSILMWTNLQTRKYKFQPHNSTELSKSQSKQEQFHKFPVGKTRLQPIGIIVFATMMGMAAIQVIQESITGIVKGFSGNPAHLNMSLITILSFLGIVVFKFILFLYCKLACRHILNVSNNSQKAITEVSAIETLSEDHLNDVVNNSLSLAIASIASQYQFLWYLDPIGAFLISLWILKGWIENGRQQIKNLVGRSAPKDFIKDVKDIAESHHPKIEGVETLLAYYCGMNIFIECHIVLDGDMPLRDAHDIGESLEIRLEEINEVERAFVHIDYSWHHEPEHATGMKKFHS